MTVSGPGSESESESLVSMEIPWKTELEIPKDLWNFHTVFEWKIDATGEGDNPASRVGSLKLTLFGS